MTINLQVQSFDQFEQAAQAVAANVKSRYLGGGTLLMREVNEGTLDFDSLITCDDAATREVVEEGERIWIGASLTMAQVLAEKRLAFLHEAAIAVGAPAIRNMATVGGNLFAPPPYGDFAVALLALSGEAVVVNAAGSNSVSLEDLFASRARGEQPLVAGISVLRPKAVTDMRFLKAQRVKPRGSSIVTIAAFLQTSVGRITAASVAYGAMAQHPIRAAAVERALVGAELNETGIAPALAAALEGTDPPTDPIASQWYRQEVAPVYLKRLLLR